MGEAARASASVSTVSRSSASAVPSREASASTVAGSSGSRVVAVSASSRCQRTSSATRSVPDSSNPIRVAMLRAIGSPATLCSVRLPLPMSWSSAATISTSGRATCRISAAASVQVSTTCRSTVNRWMADACGSSRIRSHSGRICASAPVSSRVSQVPSSPRPEASSRTSSRRASGGQGSGSGGHSRASRAAVGGASTTSRSAASVAARSSSAGSSAGRARPSSTTSLAARATPSASGVSDGRRAPMRAGRASASSTRRQVSRDRWVIRRPSSRTCTCAARASAFPS